MDHPDFNLDHRLRELRAIALERQALTQLDDPRPSPSGIALRDRLGRFLVSAGEALLAGRARSVGSA